MRWRIFPILLALLCALTLFACSQQKPSTAAPTPSPAPLDGTYGIFDTDFSTTASYEGSDGVPGGGTETASAMTPDPLRKIIWTGEVSIETQSYDEDLDEVNRLVAGCGGYVQSSAVTGGGAYSSGTRRMRSARLTLRIPSENFQLFINGTSNIATLLSSSTSSDDVTDSYFDTESRLEVLRVKEQRLLDMIEREASLEELLKLEDELSETIYEIEALSGKLRKYDGLISYSTVNLYLSEVTEEMAVIEETGVAARISSGFGRSMSGLGAFLSAVLVFFTGNSPVIIFILLLGFGVFMLIRVLTRGKKKKNTLLPPTDDTEQK